MDAALYLCLREEMQQDAARVERQLDELRRVESVLLRRIKTTSKLASYRAVLNDLSAEITLAETDHAELLHLSRFVTRALISAYETEPAAKTAPEMGPAPIPKPQPGRDKQIGVAELSSPPESRATKLAASPGYHGDGSSKSNGPPKQTPGSKSNNTPAAKNGPDPISLPAPKHVLVEFDKDGFPILAPVSSGSAPRPLPVPPREPTPVTEPPTVVFDENGFPLNPLDEDSMNTLLEVPKPKPGGNPLIKKDK